MVDGSIVVVAKCPIPGKSKTRLIPLLGKEGSAELALAMLCDILQTLTHLKESLAATTARIQLILLFAPADGNIFLQNLLEESLGIARHWMLLPMAQSDEGDLQTSHLSTKLADALERVRVLQRQQQQQQQPTTNNSIHNIEGPVVFLGMDSPETPLDELTHIFSKLSSLDTAVMCPAADGGYGLLSVPPPNHQSAAMPSQVFDMGICWSHPLTAVSQLKALTDAHIPVRMGRLMYDIDEPADVHALAQRLRNASCSSFPLSSSSSSHIIKGQAHLPAQYSHQDDEKVNIQDSVDDCGTAGTTTMDPAHRHAEKDVLHRSSAQPGQEQTSDCPCTRQVLQKYGFLPKEDAHAKE